MREFCRVIRMQIYIHRPEEILSAVEFSVPGEASFAKTGFAVGALYAADMPGSVKDVEQEPVDDGPLAPSTDHHHLSTSPSP